MINDPVFRRKDGKLTLYAFACGYIEEYIDEKLSVALWMENGCLDPYHVRSHNKDGNRLDWQCFNLISEARKEFTRQKNHFKFIDSLNNL